MKRIFGMVILTLSLFSCETGEVDSAFDLSKDQWKEDLHFLKDKIISNHAAAYHFINKNDMDLKYRKCLKQIDQSRSGKESSLFIAEFAASFGDGHTYANPFDFFQRFPIWLQWFQDKLIITAIDNHLKDYQGWEVKKMGNIEIEKVLRRVSRYIPQNESKSFLKTRSEYLLCLKDVLFALAISTNIENVELTIINNHGKEKTILLETKEYDVNKTITPEFKNEYPYRYKSSDPISTHVVAANIGYVNFRSYPKRSQTFAIATKIKEWIEEEHLKTIIFDFRQNTGGDFTIGQALLNRISDGINNANIDVFIGIGKQTYSAGMSNATHFQKQLNGVYIGQITGARPNGFQESKEFRLPNSKINCSVSVEYYEFSDIDTDGIYPDIFIEYNWKDYYLGIDPLIEKIIDIKTANKN